LLIKIRLKAILVNFSTNSPLSAQVSKDTPEAEDAYVPWSAEQAQTWRQKQRPVPIYLLVTAQFGVGAAVAVLAYALFGATAAMSAGYGAMCAALPSLLLARGMRSALSQRNPVVGFMVWELVKIALGAAMLVAAPKLLGEVNWFALLIGLILTLKVVFLAALWPSQVATKPAGDSHN
jgi:ATP synthase protein I